MKKFGITLANKDVERMDEAVELAKEFDANADLVSVDGLSFTIGGNMNKSDLAAAQEACAEKGFHFNIV